LCTLRPKSFIVFPRARCANCACWIIFFFVGFCDLFSSSATVKTTDLLLSSFCRENLSKTSSSCRRAGETAGDEVTKQQKTGKSTTLPIHRRVIATARTRKYCVLLLLLNSSDTRCAVQRRKRNYNTEIIVIGRRMWLQLVDRPPRSTRPGLPHWCLRFHLTAGLERDFFQLTKQSRLMDIIVVGTRLLRPTRLVYEKTPVVIE